jgi:hypothetical protein
MFELEFLGEADDWEQRRLPRGESSACQHLGPAWHGVLSGALFLPASPVINGERLFLRADGMIIMPTDGMVMAWICAFSTVAAARRDLLPLVLILGIFARRAHTFINPGPTIHASIP